MTFFSKKGRRQLTVIGPQRVTVPSETALLRPLERRGLSFTAVWGGRQKIVAVQNIDAEPSETALLRPLECGGKVFLSETNRREGWLLFVGRVTNVLTCCLYGYCVYLC